MNKFQTKHALVTAILAVVLCVAMLAGTTFAWFTQKVESGNNIVASGNLKVAVEYYTGSAWETIQGETELFNVDADWEPGYAEVVYLKVSNVGSLGFRSYMTVKVNQETKGVNVYGNEFKLSDYLEFATVRGVDGETNPYTDRNEVYDATEDKTMSLGHKSEYVSIMPGEAVYFALTVVMPPSIGNVANHDGVTLPKIALGIVLNATQKTEETDDFGDDYDGPASWLGEPNVTEPQLAEDAYVDANGDPVDVYYIDRPSDLAWVAKMVNEGWCPPANTKFVVGTWKGGDVDNISRVRYLDMNDMPWAPIGTDVNPFIWTFEGNGVEVDNLYVEGVTNPSLFGETANAQISGITYLP